jgi:hypothetical protein
MAETELKEVFGGADSRSLPDEKPSPVFDEEEAKEGREPHDSSGLSHLLGDLGTLMDHEVVISVTDPQLRETMLSKYVEYTIRVSTT